MTCFFQIILFQARISYLPAFFLLIMSANSSLSTLSPSRTHHIILNIISLIGTLIGTAVSFVLLAGVLLRRKTLLNVGLILCTNSYIVVFFLGIFELMHHAKVVQGDFGISIVERETLQCRVEAYIVFSLLSAVYLACVLQVSRRFVHVRVQRVCRLV